MRKYIYHFAFVFALLGCEKALIEKPKAIATETFYNSKTEIESAVNAAYFPLQSSSFNSYNTVLLTLSDIVYGRGSLEIMEDYNGFSAANITNMQGVWTQLYLAIRNANLVIENAPNAANIAEDERSAYIGEARFIRALSYFMLVRLWGRVPLRTEENMDVIDMPRTSVTEVYALIIDDLAFAEANLPDQPRLLGTASKWAAKTIAADVFLTINDYTNAMAKAGEVIRSNQFELVQISQPADYEKIYGADLVTSSEEVFYFKYNDQYGWSLMNFYHHSGAGYKPYGANYFSFYLSSDDVFYQRWDDGDFRKQHNFYSWDIGIGDKTLLFKKFIDLNGTVNASNDFPLYRYPEVLLIYAEAANAVNGGPTAESLEYYNQVRRRSYGYPSNRPAPVDRVLADFDQEAFFTAILDERAYETILECKRWFDLLRTGLASAYILEHTGRVLDETMLLWPIPEAEISYNKAIDPVNDQNPGY